MRDVIFENEHRRKHFEFFNSMEIPHFNLVADVDFKEMAQYIKLNKLHFSSVAIYLICKAANSIPELRQRIRNGKVVEHHMVHPSFTVPTEETSVFSFCFVDYNPDFEYFSKAVYTSIRSRKDDPSFEDDADRDDYLFLSAMPWVHFKGFSHAMRIKGVDSVPRIVWGKLGGYNGNMLPLGLQAHHALVDGRHAGEFFTKFQKFCDDPKEALGGEVLGL